MALPINHFVFNIVPNRILSTKTEIKDYENVNATNVFVFNCVGFFACQISPQIGLSYEFGITKSSKKVKNKTGKKVYIKQC